MPVDDSALAAATRALEPGYGPPEVVAARTAGIAAQRPDYRLAADALPAEHVDELLADAQLSAVRAVLAGLRRETGAALRLAQRSTGPDIRPALLRQLQLLDAAEAEVADAERGCGQPDGQCRCLCHAGVRRPEDGTSSGWDGMHTPVEAARSSEPGSGPGSRPGGGQ